MPSDVVRFGNNLELDRRDYELRRSGRPLELERIPMELLLLLVHRKGQLVTREEIIEKCGARTGWQRSEFRPHRRDAERATTKFLP
jgi:DNA-binding response OmpR family regulator